jgi:hypothetical protein
MGGEIQIPITIEYEFAIRKRDPVSIKTTPIVINNYNRLACLCRLVDRLKGDGYLNIYIIDNNSSYGPLLSYYQKNDLKVFYLNQNVGYLALWKTDLYKYFIDDYYVYTDPDIIPDDGCPSNYLEVFKKFLDDWPVLDKVGFGLRIDDLPSHCRLKEEVIKHESNFWASRLADNLFDAPIDTTFALYRPGASGEAAVTTSGRTGFPYVAQHRPWYVNHSNLSEEDKWYSKCKKTDTHWSDHPNNFSFFKKYYILVREDRLPLIWNIRSFLRKILNQFGKKKKA